MRRVLLLSAFVFCFAASVIAQSSQPPTKAQATHPAVTGSASPAAMQAARATFEKLPLSFEENVGQTDSRVKYTSRGAGYNLFLTSDEAVFALRGGRAPSNCPGLVEKNRLNCADAAKKQEESVLWLKLPGANPSAQILGSDPLPGRINYYIDNDPSKWRTGVRQFGRVSYVGIYPGVDLTYYGNQQQLESDFVVAPGANPRAIVFEAAGAREMHLDGQGNLVLVTDVGNVELLRPGIYQMIKGVRHDVTGRYVLRGANRVGFSVGAYHRHEKLIIDPTLVYSTYLGGSSLSGGDEALSIAIDGSGHAFVTGQGESSDFPGTDSNGPPAAAFSEFAFVTELDTTGSSSAPLVYSTMLSGSKGISTGNGISVAGGVAYLGGTTDASDFPMVNPAQATFGDASNAGFLASLASGGTLNYSTYWGGRNADDTTAINGIFADSTGNAYVVGNTSSQNFPTIYSYQSALLGYTSVVVAEFDPQGQPVYSTYLNGTGSDDTGTAIVADSNGNAYVTGETSSSAFPLQISPAPAPFQSTLNGSFNVFVSKLNFNAGTKILSLPSSTYLGGSGSDEGLGIAIDTASTPNVYVTGQTNSPEFGTTNFPTQNPISGTFTSGAYSGAAYSGTSPNYYPDAFVTKLNSDFATLGFSTYLGSVWLGYRIWNRTRWLGKCLRDRQYRIEQLPDAVAAAGGARERLGDQCICGGVE